MLPNAFANPESACYGIWTAWIVSWALAARWSSPAQSQPRILEQLPYRLLTAGGFVLLLAFYARLYRGPLRLWVLPSWAGWVMAAACAAGFAFAWWARIHLGRLWSGFVSSKAGHRIVESGPYAIVRHPIYTGLILAAIGMAIVKGTAVSAAGAVLLMVGYWLKARLEERFLRQQLGAESYDLYRRRVPMLLPFGPKSA